MQSRTEFREPSPGNGVRLNKITAANAGIALSFHVGHHWPGVAEFYRMKVDSVASGDSAEITALLDRAFSPSTFESSLMLALRGSGREVLEWVIRSNGRIAAHVAFTRAYRGRLAIGFHLAPVAVHPDLQRRGFGTALISEALVAPGIAASPVFVLGDPNYYARFGFQRVANPSCPFDPGNQHFQALRWVSDDVFTVGYEPEFQNA